ncbi:DUF6505 family protein [Arhodomonas sp. SL1]|uniref:DUF6505 family protein n=1 Tax=Arhodomonas sp. SL1 TaxID=3425691 RepID=UPI003F8855CC
MRLLRCLRLDDSDDHAYPRAAHAGEWLVTGTFAFTFSDRDPDALVGGERAAFEGGFLGLESFGWSTLAVVAEIGDLDYRRLAEVLAAHLRDQYGAPGLEAALEEARRELDYTASLADAPVNTIFSLQRRLTGEGVAEQIRIHRPQPADWQAGQPIRFVPEGTS